WLVGQLLFLPALAGTEKGVPDPFAQLDEVFPAANLYRTASGAPGPAYWQQHVRYRIAVRLDDRLETIFGDATITYENHSPDTLRYLWFQLDHNRFRPHSLSQLSRSDPPADKLPFARLTEILTVQEAGLGMSIERVEDAHGRPLAFHVQDTMMRVDLPRPLAPGGEVTLKISWHLRIPPAKEVSNRSAMERFADGAPSYFVAMWYPRPAAYTDYGGWIVKAFLYGEPALEFGDFDVRITVPETFTVAATGVLDNPSEVLGEQERRRLDEARTATRPVFVITPDEAKARSGRKPKAARTWHFKAKNVRDFAWAASPRFVWDAKGFRYPSGRFVLAQSFYPPEGMPIWNRFSTEAVIQALDVYAQTTGFEYPWPQATSVNAPIRSGMEYPMISANAPRPKDPPSYSRREKYGLIGVVIHEVGHNWFPMIVNSDERHWLWMDEGLNSFVDDIAMRLWERRPPRSRGAPARIGPIMTRRPQRPIMTLSDDYFDRGATGYRKVVAALTVLRDVVLGREVFDRAFREYVRRWAF
ncbi:MAG: M1 family peptidase, partial [Alphaproteobacteria bacterium]